MSKDIWVSSDLHLFHSNILNFTDSEGKKVRPEFSNVKEMNEHILEMHNSVVKPGDRYYCLGDVFIGDMEEFKKFWPKFNGSKNLIVGNHDNIKFLSSGGFFNKVQMWRMFPEFGLMFSHVPLHTSSMMRHVDKTKSYAEGCKVLYGIHGHIHKNKSPEGPYHNVSMEVINYTPVHIEDLIANAKAYFKE
jgi:calcineurin-like phosphoesterase family protein